MSDAAVGQSERADIHSQAPFEGTRTDNLRQLSPRYALNQSLCITQLSKQCVGIAGDCDLTPERHDDLGHKR